MLGTKVRDGWQPSPTGRWPVLPRIREAARGTKCEIRRLLLAFREVRLATRFSTPSPAIARDRVSAVQKSWQTYRSCRCLATATSKRTQSDRYHNAVRDPPGAQEFRRPAQTCRFLAAIHPHVQPA